MKKKGGPVWLLVPDRPVPGFQNLLIYWDFYAQLSPEDRKGTLTTGSNQGMKNPHHLEPCGRGATAAGDHTEPFMPAQNRKVRVQMVGSNFGVNNVTAWVHPGSTVQTAAISVLVVGGFSQHFNDLSTEYRSLPEYCC